MRGPGVLLALTEGCVLALTEVCAAAGVQQKVNQLAKLKLKGVVLGPVHVAPEDQPQRLDFHNISPDVGNLQQFRDLLQAVHKLPWVYALNKWEHFYIGEINLHLYKRSKCFARIEKNKCIYSKLLAAMQTKSELCSGLH